MKRKGPVSDGHLGEIERLASAMLEQKQTGKPIDTSHHLRALGVLMALKSKEPSAELGQAQAKSQEMLRVAERSVKRSEDVRAFNQELELQVKTSARLEAEEKKEGNVEELCDALNQIRALEKDLTLLKSSKQKLVAQKRELAGQLAQITGNVPLLDFKLGKEGKELIHLLQDSSTASLDLSVPLLVLEQSLKLLENVPCDVVASPEGSASVLHPSSLRVVLGRAELLFSFCETLDLVVVATEDHSVLVLDGGADDGLSCPSLTAFYKVGASEITLTLAALGNARPYRWCQSVCGIRVAKTIEDLSRPQLTLSEVIKQIKKC